MHLHGFMLFGIVFSGAILSAESSLFEKVLSFFSSRKRIEAIERNNIPKAREEIRESPREDICFSNLGCFEMGGPWRTISIDIPPPSPPSDIPIEVTLRTGGNKSHEYNIATHPQVDLREAPFDGNNPTVLIFDGFHTNKDEPHIQDLSEAYLNKVNANVIAIDWNPMLTDWLYVKAISNARVVARIIARMLSHLQQEYGLKADDVHVIGYGLGIQPASLLCKEFRGIGRLTALNPAQPFLENLHPQARLGREDATFVDVVHTDSKPFMEFTGPSMTVPIGDVDFYMNGGMNQPGCGPAAGIPNSAIPTLYISDMKSCNHIRAIRYFTEAVKARYDCIFWGHKVQFAELSSAAVGSHSDGFLDNFISRSCSNETCSPLGLQTREYPARGVFVVKTRSKSPYCLHEPGIPNRESLVRKTKSRSITN